MRVMKRVRLDWSDERMILSTNRVAGILGCGWAAAMELMKSGKIPSQQFGKKSQPYYRTSLKTVRAFMDGKLPDNSGPSGVTEPTG